MSTAFDHLVEFLAESWQFVATGVGAGIVGAWTYLRSKHEDLARHIHTNETSAEKRWDAIEQRVTMLESNDQPDHSGRIAAVEEALRLGVNHEDMRLVYARFDSMSADIGAIKGSLSGIEKTVEMVHRHIISHSSV